MEVFFLVIIVAITIEALVEYGKSVQKLAVEKDKKPLILQLCALVGGMALCVFTGADIYQPLGIVFKYPMVGSLFTGIFVSRGSNYISDLIGRLRNGGGYMEISELRVSDKPPDAK